MKNATDLRIFEWTRSPALSWDPVQGGKRSWLCFDDVEEFPLGADPTGERFRLISERMLSGHYYPADAVRFSGEFLEEGRRLKVGDRVIQSIPLFGKRGGPCLQTVVEIFVASGTSNRTEVGYVTTERHFARGDWKAVLVRENDDLMLTVRGKVCPKFLFALGLPFARYMQMRAWRRAVEEFRKV